MSIIKLISTSLLAIGVSSVSIYAQAAGKDLHLFDNTNEDSTTSIGGVCSTWLPGGVTKAHQPNVVTHDTLSMACWGQENACKAEIFMNASCSDSSVASVVFDVDNGLVGKPVYHSSKYVINGSGFNFSMDYAS